VRSPTQHPLDAPVLSLRFPEPLLVDGIVEGTFWGMTLRLLEVRPPRLLAGEWDV
jgi:hypothetical protein